MTVGVDHPSTSAAYFDVDRWIEITRKCQYLPEGDFSALCDIVMRILADEPNVVEVQTPVTLAGDIHGQYYDMEQIWKLAGEPPQTKYIFLGDFIDRGRYSLETITRLLCLKVKYPQHMIMLRGNHESRGISIQYGFYSECESKYGHAQCWRLLMETFDLLPIAAIVDDKVLCVHGGLSPDVKTIDQIDIIDRQCDVPQSGAFCDLLWSDPDSSTKTWGVSQRGAGFAFGRTVVERFLTDNGLKMIARAHQLVQAGIDWMWDKQLVTVWSAPNYCYRCGNSATILQLFSNGDHNVITFEAVPDDERSKPAPNASPYFL